MVSSFQEKYAKIYIQRPAGKIGEDVIPERSNCAF